MRKVKVEEVGDSKFLAGSQVEIIDFDEENERLKPKDCVQPLARSSSLVSPRPHWQPDSFLSAASFQETTKVLTDSAIKGKSDHLIGLKENVILRRSSSQPVPACAIIVALSSKAKPTSAYDQVTDSTAGENAEGEDGIVIQEAPVDHQEKKERRPVFI